RQAAHDAGPTAPAPADRWGVRPRSPRSAYLARLWRPSTVTRRSRYAAAPDVWRSDGRPHAVGRLRVLQDLAVERRPASDCSLHIRGPGQGVAEGSLSLRARHRPAAPGP